MDYLSENRYQLLFIDDDELMTDGNDAVEPIAAQQQQPQEQQSKSKRNKNKNVIKPILGNKLEEKQSQQQQQTPRAAPEKKLPQQQSQQHLQQQLQEQPKDQPQQQTQQQIQQQLQSEQQLQQQPEQQAQQQPQPQQPQFRYRQRIINNSNRFAGARFGFGVGVGAAPYRGNSTRNAKTNNNTNTVETDKCVGNNIQVVDDKKYITVEQWKATRGERAKPIYNIRKPGEGEPNNKFDWKHMTVLQKSNDDNKSKLSEGNPKSEEVNGLDYDSSTYPQRVGRLQRIVDIEFKFKDDRRRSGAYRSDNAAQQQTANQTQQSLTQVATNNNDFEAASDQFNMNDEAEFPTLG